MTVVTKIKHIKKVKYVWQKLRFLTKVYYIQSAYFLGQEVSPPQRTFTKNEVKETWWIIDHVSNAPLSAPQAFLRVFKH